MLNPSLFSSKSFEWSTPQELFDSLNKEFHFELDVCASLFNHKCLDFFTIKENGLIQDWCNKIVWCNPPYGKGIEYWVERCCYHSNVAVMLLPARTDTRWFHNYIYKYSRAEIRFLKGRLKFGGSKNSAPFPSMVVIFNSK